MQALDLILTLTGCLAAALVFGYITHRAGLSPIVGYLLAGVVVGPNTPGLAMDVGLAEHLAEIGVVLLMFGVGLQFHVDELLAVRRVALPGAVVHSTIATVLGALLAMAFGWTFAAAVIFGLALSVASTVVTVRILTDNRALHTPTGHMAVGWLVVEDVFTVLALVVLPQLFGPHESRGPALASALVTTAAKVAALGAFTAVVGARMIPWTLERVARTGSRELFTLTVLVVALGIAVGSAAVFDVSMALGAFLAGLVVGRSDYASRAASEALPLRDAFAVLFFVSVGMLFDPAALLEAPLLLVGALLVVIVAKPLVAYGILWLMRYPFATAASVAVALGQIGEFSFMLSRVGAELGVFEAFATNLLVAVAIASILINPVLYRLVDRAERWVLHRPALAARLTRPSPAATEPMIGPPTDPAHRAVVVGYGPSGRTVTRLLLDNEIVPTVIELDVAAIRELRAQGIAAVHGDATHHHTLECAGVGESDSLVLTSSGMRHARESIRIARELNPDVHVLARATYLRDVEGLRRAGAETVFSAEGEVALALTEAILVQLGATPEQIDLERERVRGELRT